MGLNDQLRSYTPIRPDGRERNKRVRLLGRLVCGPASSADPSPPSRMHGQHGIRMDPAPGKPLVVCHLASRSAG
jgi:hypothetical protein